MSARVVHSFQKQILVKAYVARTARGAPNTSLRKMFEDIATEYDKLAEREDEIVR